MSQKLDQMLERRLELIKISNKGLLKIQKEEDDPKQAREIFKILRKRILNIAQKLEEVFKQESCLVFIQLK